MKRAAEGVSCHTYPSLSLLRQPARTVSASKGLPASCEGVRKFTWALTSTQACRAATTAAAGNGVAAHKPAWLLPRHTKQPQVVAAVSNAVCACDTAHRWVQQPQQHQQQGRATALQGLAQRSDFPVAGEVLNSHSGPSNSDGTSGAVSQQQQQQLLQQDQQGLRPVLYAHSYVQLLQQAALVRSWSAAQRLLLQHAGELQQAHIALLWWQLGSKLRQQRRQQQQRLQQQFSGSARQAAGNRTRLQPSRLHSSVALQQQQQQQQVLQHLCQVTQQHVASLTPQSLAYTMQGLAAAVAAGAATLSQQQHGHVLQQEQEPGSHTHHEQFMASGADADTASVAAVQLPPELPMLLWARLMAVAGSCTAQQLASCLEAGQLLEWQLASSSASSSSTELCCWPVLEQASTGLLGSGLLLQEQQLQQQQHKLQWSSKESGQLLHALAGYVKQQRLKLAEVPVPPQHQQAQPQQVQQQQQQHQGVQQQHPHIPSGSSLSSIVQRLADQACTVLPVQQVLGSGLGQGVTFLHTARGHTLANSSAADASVSAVAGSSLSSGSGSSTASDVCSEAVVAAVICSLQAAALLQVLPSPARLEVLLTELEPQLQAIPARQLLQLLQALTDLGLEPWASWLSSCYAGFEAGIQQLQPQQLLQLLQLLPRVSSVQPSRQMLAGIAKMTAVHAGRCSWRQLAALPLSLAAVGYRPEPYWLEDFVAASSAHMTRHQQRQQQSQQQAQQHMQLLVDMLLGVSWLAAASKVPPTAWVKQVEQQLLAALRLLQPALSTGAGGLDTDAASSAVHVVLLPQQQQQQQHGALPADSASLVLAAFKQLLRNDSGNGQESLSTLSGVCNGSASRSSSSSSSSGDGQLVTGRLLLHGTSHNSTQESTDELAVAGLLNSSGTCPGSLQHQQQHHHQQQGVVQECHSLAQLLQQAGVPQFGAVSVPGWQRRAPHAGSSSINGGRRRHGLSTVPFSGSKVDKSTMLAKL